jgi:hypothetical protein
VTLADLVRTCGYRLQHDVQMFRDRASYKPLKGLPDPRAKSFFVIHPHRMFGFVQLGVVILPPWVSFESIGVSA